jgi:hypothetical protein
VTADEKARERLRLQRRIRELFLLLPSLPSATSENDQRLIAEIRAESDKLKRLEDG